jgi:hypothetical protein
MNVLHMLNVADFAFMAVGVAVALLLIVVGGSDNKRRSD